MAEGEHKGYWFHPQCTRSSILEQLLGIEIRHSRKGGRRKVCSNKTAKRQKLIKPNRQVAGKAPRFVVVTKDFKEAHATDEKRMEDATIPSTGPNWMYPVSTLEMEEPSAIPNISDHSYT